MEALPSDVIKHTLKFIYYAHDLFNIKIVNKRLCEIVTSDLVYIMKSGQPDDKMVNLQLIAGDYSYLPDNLEKIEYLALEGRTAYNFEVFQDIDEIYIKDCNLNFLYITGKCKKLHIQNCRINELYINAEKVKIEMSNIDNLTVKDKSTKITAYWSLIGNKSGIKIYYQNYFEYTGIFGDWEGYNEEMMYYFLHWKKYILW